MSVHIDYESVDFKSPGSVANGEGVLEVSWDDILWAALTIGRPNREYVFRHGVSSAYEALFRLSLVRMALEQRGSRGTRLWRTAAARTLDPSEKGAINYFLGLAFAKMFAAKCLNVHWLLHLDVFRPQLNTVLAGRSRPDLVGQTPEGHWVALECKGRISRPNSKAKERAKSQAARVVSVNGQAPVLCVGAITYFRNDVAEFFWQDPEPNPEQVKRPVALEAPPESWRYPYLPVLRLIEANSPSTRVLTDQLVLTRVESADVEVGIHPTVLRRLLSGAVDDPRPLNHLAEHDLPEGSPWQYRRDGIAVVTGKTWSAPFVEGEGQSGLEVR
jgi:hypothetical protein